MHLPFDKPGALLSLLTHQTLARQAQAYAAARWVLLSAPHRYSQPVFPQSVMSVLRRPHDEGQQEAPPPSAARQLLSRSVFMVLLRM